MSINRIQDQIIEELSEVDEWMDKYEYLIKQSKTLSPMAESLRTEDNAIAGCQSKVWISAELKDGKLNLLASSDTVITRGIISVVLKVLNNQSPKDVADADLYFIKEIGLSSNLSPSRANGLASIIKQIKLYGKKLS